MSPMDSLGRADPPRAAVCLGRPVADEALPCGATVAADSPAKVGWRATAVRAEGACPTATGGGVSPTGAIMVAPKAASPPDISALPAAKIALHSSMQIG